MKKIHLMSDLHLERHYHVNRTSWVKNIITQNADYLILAGDICNRPQLKDVITEFTSIYKNVIYVTGNHEYYNTEPNDIHDILNKAQSNISNFHWLHNEMRNIDGLNFIGGTLWFPKHERPIYDERIYISDFHVIKNFEPWVYQEHQAMLDVLNKDATNADVIISHHLPADKCIDSQFRFGNMNKLNPYFCFDLTEKILQWQPPLMVFGHTHCPFDGSIKKTRLVCNPLGYITHSINTDRFYNPKLISIDK